MRYICISMLFLMVACGQKNNSFSVDIPSKKIRMGDTLSVLVTHNKQVITDFSLQINGKKLPKTEKGYILNPKKVGEQTLDLVIDDEVVNQKKIFVYAQNPPEMYTYTIVNEYPHDVKSFTQGIEFQNDTLYESTGLNGKSSLRKTDYKTGKILQKIDLPNEYFGEGITILNNKIYQLTWVSNVGFIYDLSFQKIGQFPYGKSKEGWGLCNDGDKFFKSDGSDKIWILNKTTLLEEDFLQICSDQSTYAKANELEYVNGYIYANTYTKDGIMIIDSKSGALVGIVNMSGLKNKVTQHPEIDVLNGIAYSPTRKTFFVTGKNWDKLFEVTFHKKE